jgi:hypothetical protein
VRSGRAALAAATALFAVACAHVEAPRGGPEDKTPPALVSTQPDSGAVVAGGTRGAVVFTFDERISERGVEDAVLVSPLTSPVSVGHSGSRLRVSLRQGWQAGHVYHVTLLPGLADLFGNRTTTPVRLVFSTGPAIPDTELGGTAIDRITGKPEVGARIEAILAADSTVYALPSDSAGRFDFAQIPEGDYLVRGYRDLNRNRTLDAFEPNDTARVRVAVGEPATVRLSVVAPDTTPPEVKEARVANGIVEVVFDDYLDPAQSFAAGTVRLFGPGGASVAIARTAVGRLAPRDTARTDTLRTDTLRADTAATRRAAAPRDTTAAALPSQTLAIEPVAPLVPGAEYRVVVEGARNVVAHHGGGEATITVPAAPAAPVAPPAPAAPRDTTAAPPAAAAARVRPDSLRTH